MAKVTIISGFLGAGKTTFIKKLLEQVYAGQKVVLIENEFGEIGIDGGFLKDAGIQITEMNSGCICCSLVGDFGKALIKVSKEYAPDRIIIEPSGVGKLSDVVAAVERVKDEAGLELDCFLTVADATKAKMYMKNFGEFYNDQIEHAGTIVLSRTQNMDAAKLEASVALIRDKNAEAAIITTPWDELNGEQIVSALEKKSLMDELLKEALEHSAEHHHDDDDEDEDEHEHHHHHHHEDGEECCCGHHHDDDDDEDEDEHEHHHHHHHEDGGECSCGCGHHHHHHHADDVFTSWGRETPHVYTKEEIEDILVKLTEKSEFGIILRAKGMVSGADGRWIYFDAVPEEYEIRDGGADYTGRICVIGQNLNEEKLEKLFKLA
ncbi:MAG TPA: cobalamin biosynthesis protein CobW [Eubacterium sp.]|nr:cobalamin biosynthesis protein CobW [Eubacterium sp.]HAZ86582.1 cobalamin biosynthesis protein CobW [Eubacterium sp.]